MARYNEKRINNPEVQKTVTHQGGTGLTQKAEHELIGILSTGLDNTYYEKENERTQRLHEVIKRVAEKNPVFAAKALIYARTVFGQRSVTHVGAVDMLPFLAGTELGKRFYSKRERNANKGGIVYRLDDMAEILAVYQAKNGVNAPIPNAIKKGFKDAIEHADTYTLAKYQMKSRGVSLVDIVNLVHPTETKIQGTVTVSEDEYQKAIKGTKFSIGHKDYKPEYANIAVHNEAGAIIPALHALVLGILKQFNTVEDKNTEAGKVVAEKVKKGEITAEHAKVELNEAKTDNFKELIESKKIGYLALIRNLRNILKTNDTALLDKACELLVQKDFIRKSLVWPHQIDLALEIMLLEFSGQAMAKVTKALNEAYELSIPNLEHLLPEGKTAVVFDTSGSMHGTYGQIHIDNKTVINKAPIEKAALIAATFAKGIYGDVYQFASWAKQITGWNPNDSVNTLKKNFMSHMGECDHGTDFGSCFKLFEQTNKRYDRVIIISDEQDGYNRVESNFNSYCQKFGTPYVYIINICGYANTSPIKGGQKVFRLYGYNQDLYDKITQMEINPAILIEEINKIEI